MNFSLEGWVDNYITAFKIEQNIRDVFYKNKTFWVLYKGLKIGCCVGFPESIASGEKTVSYSFSQENQIKMTFNLSVETYQPCFDMSTAIPSDSVIEHIGVDINNYGTYKPSDKKLSLELCELDKDVYKSGDVIDIRWNAKSNVMEACSIMLYYVTPDNDKHLISLCNGMK